MMVKKSVTLKLIPVLLYLFAGIFNSFSQTPDGKEMRAVWIATVKNIDFPSNKFLSVEEQKEEYINMLDYFSEIGINAVMFQIRPAADAFYESDIELWSEWLTGKQGKAPEPYYDPLKFYIEEAHKREIEFHAWINPLRAVATIEFADVAENHITNQKPEWFFTYHIHKYFNPGIPEVREYIFTVVQDIVKRYDIDGVHFDDYFYPYPVRDSRNRMIRINDTDTYFKHNTDSLTIEDWRRSNMDKVIEGVNKVIKEEKPWLPFGVAPSGVWRNKRNDPNGSDTRGLAHYDYLYADVLKWLKNDWIDYVAPQLYWPIGNKYADYKILTDWWSEHTYGKHLYIGQAVYRADKDSKNPDWREPDQLIKQFKINRENSNVAGTIFYKAKAMTTNPFGFCDSLKTVYYAQKVETPEMEWLKPTDTLVADIKVVIPDTLSDINNKIDIIGFSVNITKLGKKVMISWDSIPGQDIVYNIYRYSKDEQIRFGKDKLYKQVEKNFIIFDRKRKGSKRKKYKLAITLSDSSGYEIFSGKLVELKLAD